ncbi:hypothetical protein [Pseudomonas sp.]|uniref:hypothetical protein n=1 Tax=Pseudomonas sp. TaxID=306 RepID=UPI003F3E84FD
MLVSAKQHMQNLPLPKQWGKDPLAEAAAGSDLQGSMMQALQTNVQAQIQTSATQQATQQVSEASKISDNVDEAFAKTRVALQTAESSRPPVDGQFRSSDSPASDAFKQYMSKTPEERIQDSILEEMGLTKEEVEQMPPEKQQTIAKEIAERMEDKIKLAQAEKENGSSEKGSSQIVDKFLASL